MGSHFMQAVMKYLWVIILILVAYFAISIGWKHYDAAITAQEALTAQVKQQSGLIAGLQTDYDLLKKSQKTTLDILDQIDARLAKVDQDAKKRATELSAKIKAITNDPSLSEDQKDKMISQERIQSLWQTYCRSHTTHPSCQVQP